ncbi:carboxypeptidase N subunit 2-like [Aphidius gifuensis]|uniref:carboxypeptidase N subunit 2-like n=1 Tax=Aphidius gifuensis TaxID=684658 RepID=UPI001CDC3A15|nr:carboxypeptidase N subunit 2-like [Aphidius gifuensis]
MTTATNEILSISNNILTSLPQEILDEEDSNIFEDLGASKFLPTPTNNSEAKDSIVQKNDMNNQSTIENIGNNNLTSLPQNIFSELKSLRRLKLDTNKLTSLELNTFHNLYNLEILSISNNNLTTLPQGIIDEEESNIFDDLVNLRVLDIHNNNLTDLPTYIFFENYALQFLCLQSNNLNELKPEVFDYVMQLHLLNIKDNKFSLTDDDKKLILNNMQQQSYDESTPYNIIRNEQCPLSLEYEIQIGSFHFNIRIP